MTLNELYLTLQIESVVLVFPILSYPAPEARRQQRIDVRSPVPTGAGRE